MAKPHVIWALAGLVLLAGLAIALVISASQGRFNVTGNVQVTVSLSLPTPGGRSSPPP